MQSWEVALCVGSVFQNPRTQFFNVDSTGEMAFALESRSTPEEEIRKRVAETVSELGIRHLADRSIFSLSGGEKQRIAFASAWAARPTNLVLDEPTSNLDMQAIMDLRSYVATAKAAGASVLVAEHRLWWLAGIADEIVVMGDGRVTKRLSAQEFASLSAREVRELGLRVRSLNDVAASARVTADSQTRSESAPRADGRAGAGEVFQRKRGSMFATRGRGTESTRCFAVWTFRCERERSSPLWGETAPANRPSRARYAAWRKDRGRFGFSAKR